MMRPMKCLHIRYCSSPTFSIQSTARPSCDSWMAMCVMAVVPEAPCQCFNPGGNQMTSPGLISWTGPPFRCTQPSPAVTISVCPSGCVCQAVRAPGSKVTWAPLTRAGSGAANNGSMRTVPVNQSSGPFWEGRDPFLLMSMSIAVSFSASDARAEALPPMSMSLRVTMACLRSWRIASGIVDRGIFVLSARSLLDDVLDDRCRGESIGPSGVEGEMAEHLAGFLPRQPVVHCAVQMIGDLRNLTRGNQRAHGHQAAVARSQRRPEPEIAEQHVGRILDKARRDLPELLSDARCPLLLRRFVERQLRSHRGRELIGADVAALEDLLRSRDRINRVGPAGVEGQMRDDLRYFRRLHAILQRETQIVWQLHRLTTGDESCDGDDAAVPRRETRSLPQIAIDKFLRVAFEDWRDRTDVFRL